MYVSRLTLVFHPPPHLTATRSARTSTTARHTCAAGARPGATASCTRTVRRRSSTWVHSSCSTAHAHTALLVASYEVHVMIAQDIEHWFSFLLLAYLQDGDIDYTMMGRDVCMGDHKVPSLSVTVTSSPCVWCQKYTCTTDSVQRTQYISRYMYVYMYLYLRTSKVLIEWHKLKRHGTCTANTNA